MIVSPRLYRHGLRLVFRLLDFFPCIPLVFFFFFYLFSFRARFPSIVFIVSIFLRFCSFFFLSFNVSFFLFFSSIVRLLYVCRSRKCNWYPMIRPILNQNDGDHSVPRFLRTFCAHRPSYTRQVLRASSSLSINDLKVFPISVSRVRV